MTRLPRTVAAVLLAAGTLAVPAQAFAAPGYPVNPDSITVSTTSVTAGGSITVSAKTFEPGSDVEVTTALDGAATLLGASTLGGGRGATALVVAAASGSCETGSTCTVAAADSGVATATVALTKSGATNITMSGVGVNGEPLTQTVAVNVATAVPVSNQAPASDLATTGPRDLIQTLVIALGMLAVGTVLVLMVRRRRDTVVTA